MTANSVKKVWITWGSYRRSRELARALNVSHYELEFAHRKMTKYIDLILRTWFILRNDRPEIVFCQNPSIVLSFFLVSVKRIFQFVLIVDAHNAGIFPFEERFSILNLMTRMIHRRADLTIVSNDRLKFVVEKADGRAFVLHDKIPSFHGISRRPLMGQENVLFICTFSEDEPYNEVIEAARKIDRRTVIYVTGHRSRLPQEIVDLPKNVIFTDFLPEDQYIEMIASADVIIDLTTRENCLVCGAYESIALGKPLIVSDTGALRELLPDGVLFTNNRSDDIADKIRLAIEDKMNLRANVRKLRESMETRWEEKKRELELYIETMCSNES